MENDNDPVTADEDEVEEEASDDEGDFSASSEDWEPIDKSYAESDSSSDDFVEEQIPSKRNFSNKNKTNRWEAAPKVLTRRTICRKVIEPKMKPYECVEILEPPKVPQKKSYESDSDSSGDDHLIHPSELNLNSTFFQTAKENVPDFNEIEQNIMDGVDRLTDSSEEDFDEITENAEEIGDELEENVSNEAADVDDSKKKKVNLHQLQEYARALSDAKTAMQNYKSFTKAKKKEKLNIHKLLALGESKPTDKSVVSDFESDDDEFEEVKPEIQKPKSVIPKEGIEVTVAFPNLQVVKQKKKQDVMDMIKRRMNHVKKQYQVYMHKVHVLCWLGHGNYVNSIINSDILMSLCLSLIPSKDCYPPKQADIKYLEMILKWFVTKMQYDNRKTAKEPFVSMKELEKNKLSLLESLSKQIVNKKVESRRDLILIFVSVLRTLGLQCRLVLSFQTLPLKPPASELCSLSKKPSEDPKPKKAKRRESKKHKVNVSLLSKNKKVKDKTKFYKVVDLSEVENGKTDIKVDTTEINSKLFKNETNLPKKIIPRRPEPEIKRKTIEIEAVIPDKKKPITIRKPNLQKLRKTESDLDEDWEKSMESEKSKPKRTPKKKNPNTEPTEKPKLPKKKTVKQKKVENVNTDEMLEMEKYKDMDIAEKVKMGRRKTVLKNVLETARSSDYDSAFDEMNKIEINAPWKVQIAKPKTEKINTDLISKANRESEEKVINTRKSTSKTVSSAETNIKTENVKGTKNNATVSSTFSEVKSKSRLQSNPPIFSAKKTRSKTRLLNEAKNLKISQLDGVDEENSAKSKKHNLSKLLKLKSSQMKPESHSQNRSPFTKKTKNQIMKIDSIPGSSKESDAQLLARVKANTEKSLTSKPNQQKSSKSSEKRKLTTKSDTENELKPSAKKQATGDAKIKTDKGKSKTVAKRKSISDSENEFVPSSKKIYVDKSKTDTNKLKKQDKKSTRSIQENTNTKGCDIWVEVFLESEEKWISVDVPKMHVHCINLIYARATHPVTYVVAWNNDKSIKDITKKYVPHWNTVTRKLRADPIWWELSIKPWISNYKSIRDRMEDEDLNRMIYDQPLPASIVEYKNHPLYALERHLLKFEAIYPPNAPTLGFCKKEAVYARECIYTLHSRETWVKQAKVVRPGEKPYKIVKARPKYDRLSNKMITDIPLEIFGPWQTQDYEPPVAENGIVPRNEYGNVELFKACMLPINTVHLNLPGLNKVARKLQIDCAPAVTGFDYHSGSCHPTFDGFVVCQEFKDTLVAAWEQEQVEAEKRAVEKMEKRVYGNWRKLIKGLLIKERLKIRYQYEGSKPEEPEPKPEPPVPSKKKVKQVTFCTKRRR